MASTQEPEVQFAQRLASNEKPVRSKAMKKLRKYINVRSQKATGGFTGDELLKLWKGLFYCLWMQDKPLLQEELSNQISSLIHSFQTVDGQILYLESFLQTFKREWTGIDRLRMDKFFQLVRFMFRQTFEMLKRKNWESSVVSRFLELLTAQLLQSSSGAPSGLQFHILDLYMAELAAVGSAQLTADQNLIFIEPFCKTAAKTKDRTLFRAICSSIFSTIIDQAPFAIEDLMKEVKAAEESDSDSGQASEEDDEDDQLKKKTRSKPVGKKATAKQMNGSTSNKEEEEEEEEEDEDEDEEEHLHLEDSDTEAPCEDDIGPVLQFDYAALADKLFELASRSSTPSQNRQRLYKIITVLRDLSEGVFPQDEYPEEVSTDEDDEMFGSRKRMKRRGGRMEEEEEGAPTSKKSKGKKKEASTLSKQNKDTAEDDSEPADLTAHNENKKKKRKKRKKKRAGQGEGEGGENEQIVAQSTTKETEGSQKETMKQSSISSVTVTEAAPPEGQSETLLLSEAKEPPSVTVTEDTSQPSPCTTDNHEQSEKSKKTSETELEPAAEPERLSAAAVSGKKKKRKKGLKAELQTDVTVADSQVSAEAASSPVSGEESTPGTEATAAKKKKKGVSADRSLQEVEGESRVNGVSAEEDGPPVGLENPADPTTTAKKKSKKKNLKAAEAEAQVEGKHTDAKVPSGGEEASADKKKTKKKGLQEDTTLRASPAEDESSATPVRKKRKNNQKESKTTEEEEGVMAEPTQVEDAEKLSITTSAKKKKKRKQLAAAQVDEIKDQSQVQVGSGGDAEVLRDETEVLSSSGKPAKKKKRKIPVVFEFEADELEAAASINGLAEEETAAKKTKLLSDAGEPSTPLSTKKSQKKAKTPSGSTSDFITFQSDAAVPTPLFCKTKGSPGTPLSSKKKSQTPKSESKKVTFGLKNNKTAEFRKTDRSLLVSPDGSSRVPFDPKQKPKFGVLKSPATPLSTRVKKTPNGTRKTGSGTPKSTPRRRPSAADFF